MTNTRTVEQIKDDPILKQHKALEQIAFSANGGLCSFNGGSKHVFLLEIARICQSLDVEVPGLDQLPS